jgi:hypothetical protein
VFARFRSVPRAGSASRFTEPYLFDIPLRAGVDVYDRERSSRLHRGAAGAMSGGTLAEYVTLGGNYRLENVTISDVNEAASDDLKRESGTRSTRSSRWRSPGTPATTSSAHDRGPSQPDVAFAGLGRHQVLQGRGGHLWFLPLPLQLG